jgi:hypothetical protein
MYHATPVQCDCLRNSKLLTQALSAADSTALDHDGKDAQPLGAGAVLPHEDLCCTMGSSLSEPYLARLLTLIRVSNSVKLFGSWPLQMLLQPSLML